MRRTRETSSGSGAQHMAHRYPGDRQAAAAFTQRFAPITLAQHTHRVATIEQRGDRTLHSGVPEVVAPDHARPRQACLLIVLHFLEQTI